MGKGRALFGEKGGRWGEKGVGVSSGGWEDGRSSFLIVRGGGGTMIDV
jgi:hypothetical protein